MSGKLLTVANLTAPGNSAAIQTGLNVYHTLVAKVTDVDTNVVLRAEGTIDGTNWFNLKSDATDTTITEDGVYPFLFVGMLEKIRLVFVSETEATNATIAVSYLG